MTDVLVAATQKKFLITADSISSGDSPHDHQGPDVCLGVDEYPVPSTLKPMLMHTNAGHLRNMSYIYDRSFLLPVFVFVFLTISSQSQPKTKIREIPSHRATDSQLARD